MSATSSYLNLRRSFHGITFGYLFLTALIVALGVTSFRMSKVGTEHSAELSTQLLPGLQALAGLQESVLKYNLTNQEFVTARDDETQKRKRSESARLRNVIDVKLTALAGYFSDTEAATLEKAIGAAVATYDDANKRLQKALSDNEFDAAMQILDGDMAKSYGVVEQALASLGTFIFDLSNRNGDDTRQVLERNLRITLMLSATIGGVALISVFCVQLVSIRMRGRFTQLSGVLGGEADDILVKAGNFNTSSIQLAEGANQQAAALEESSASLETMATMTQQNSDAAQHAKTIAGQTRTAVDAGAASMKRMAGTMAEIQSSSGEIAKIIKTIDEIAFQTNLLALNAAVEAARAGEAGAGFAVVADEVRSLAQRSAQAAKETADQIDGALRKSEEGARMSIEVLTMLTGIVESVRRMDEIVAKIAEASIEQSRGIQQVTAGVSEMDKVTQGNAATAEESAGAAQELSSQASELQSMVQNLRHLVGVAAETSNASRPVAMHHQPLQAMRSAPRRSAPARRPVAAANSTEFFS